MIKYICDECGATTKIKDNEEVPSCCGKPMRKVDENSDEYSCHGCSCCG